MISKLILQRGLNLRAVPYDWRLPPMRLEERDRYFTRLKGTLEDMVEAARRPAVIVSHSLGGKIVHYFLAWISNVYKAPKGKFDPKSWIDKHVHTFMPVRKRART